MRTENAIAARRRTGAALAQASLEWEEILGALRDAAAATGPDPAPQRQEPAAA